MKKMILISLVCLGMFAQTGKVVELTWVDTANPTGTTYNIKRATGVCTGTPNFSTIATGITSKTYTDATVSIGSYCYGVTATFNNIESANSNTVNPIVPPKEVTSVSAVVK